MKKFCRILVCLFVGFLIVVSSFNSAKGDSFLKSVGGTTQNMKVNPATWSGNELTGSIAEGTSYETDKLKGILQFPERKQYSTTLGYAIRLIQVSINRILGILATVALIYMLYCGFLVFSSGADEKNAQKGRKGIKTAAIALAGIGLSWLIVSAMIWFITMLTKST